MISEIKNWDYSHRPASIVLLPPDAGHLNANRSSLNEPSTSIPPAFRQVIKPRQLMPYSAFHQIVQTPTHQPSIGCCAFIRLPSLQVIPLPTIRSPTSRFAQSLVAWRILCRWQLFGLHFFVHTNSKFSYCFLFLRAVFLNVVWCYFFLQFYNLCFFAVISYFFARMIF